MDREREATGRGGGGERGKGKVGGVERNESQDCDCLSEKSLKNSAAFRIPVEWKRVTESEKKKTEKLTDEGTIQQ